MKPAAAISALAALACSATANALEIDQIGRYGLPDTLVVDDGDLVGSNPAFDGAAAEIASFDKDTGKLFVTNSFLQGIDVLDLSDPTSPAKVGFIDTTGEGDEPTSCAVVPGGGVAYDISGPASPLLAAYVNGRLPVGAPGAGASTLDDLGPECVVFIPAADSPDGTPLIAVPHEVSGSTVIYRLTP